MLTQELFLPIPAAGRLPKMWSSSLSSSWRRGRCLPAMLQELLARTTSTAASPSLTPGRQRKLRMRGFMQTSGSRRSFTVSRWIKIL
uniref:Uncharacterized protein n=1 Tax=Arundo donax TaxID=35708 RepID=A0A0A9BZV3_ARUDO